MPIPADLAKLSNVVKNEYNKLVSKVDNIDTTNFVLKIIYEKEGSNFEDKISKIDKKIPDVSSLVKKTDYSSKITELENKIPNVSGFLLTSVFNSKITEVKNIIPNVSYLVIKSDYVAEIIKFKNDYVTNAAMLGIKILVQKSTFGSELRKADDKAIIKFAII